MRGRPIIPVPKDVLKAARRRKESGRPCCPSCGQRVPHPMERDSEWFYKFGHRNTNGEPCPGWPQPVLVQA